MEHAASRFPDPRLATEEGIVAVGGELTVATLLDAYSHGIFPWPHEKFPFLWFSPAERGIIDLKKEIKIPTRFDRTLKKWIREKRIEVRIDTAFEEVIRACREAYRAGQDGTWILPAMEKAYIELHRAGSAHSVEVFLDGKLAGGLYGVYVRGMFSGESMFHREPDAGKVALVTLLRLLKATGAALVDVQMVTPVVAAFGGTLISRDEFLKRLEKTQDQWDREVCRFEWVKGPVSL